jgi:hypothetical protein
MGGEAAICAPRMQGRAISPDAAGSPRDPVLRLDRPKA